MGQSLALSQWDTPLTVGQMGRFGQMGRPGQMRQRRSAIRPTVSVAVLSAVSPHASVSRRGCGKVRRGDGPALLIVH
jgi:hypothetical protein